MSRAAALVEASLVGGGLPREEHWQKRKPQPIRDATLDSVIKQAYDKAMGRTVAEPAEVVSVVEFDHESDDEDVLMLMMG